MPLSLSLSLSLGPFLSGRLAEGTAAALAPLHFALTLAFYGPGDATQRDATRPLHSPLCQPKIKETEGKQIGQADARRAGRRVDGLFLASKSRESSTGNAELNLDFDPIQREIED